MTPMMIRVLVVDDSIVFRKRLEQGLSTDRQIQVVGTAVDTYDAMKKIEALHPDVITMDVEMPKMSGIEFVKKLIPQHPIPVVVVTSMPINAFDAMEAGAVDFVKKPVVKKPSDFDDFMRDLIFKVKIARTAKVRISEKYCKTYIDTTSVGGSQTEQQYCYRNWRVHGRNRSYSGGCQKSSDNHSGDHCHAAYAPCVHQYVRAKARPYLSDACQGSR